MKQVRQEVILQLIETHMVANQEDLQELLKQAGYPVTQSTISRDIRELNLSKRADGNGGYHYVRKVMQFPQEDWFIGNIQSIDYAGNTVVIKCRSGTAQAVCTLLDGFSRPDIVGTIAGDDTIFVLIRTEEQAKHFCREIKTILVRG